MELMDNFREEEWKKGDYEITKGFNEYRIIRTFKLGEYFEYAMFDNDGGMTKLRLYGSSSKTYDPLNGLNNVFLSVDDNLCVIGVIVEDECVVRRGSKAEAIQDEEAAKRHKMNHVDETLQANGDENNKQAVEDEEISLSVGGRRSSVPHCATCTCGK